MQQLKKIVSMVPTVTHQQIVELWGQVKAQSAFGEMPVGWSIQCLNRPELVALGANDADGGEIFEVLHLADRRIVHEDEFPSENFERLRWADVRERS